jgi:hypothetical protein
VSVPERSDDLPRFSKGRVGPYGGRLLPVCCPGSAPSSWWCFCTGARSDGPTTGSGHFLPPGQMAPRGARCRPPSSTRSPGREDRAASTPAARPATGWSAGSLPRRSSPPPHRRSAPARARSPGWTAVQVQQRQYLGHLRAARRTIEGLTLTGHSATFDMRRLLASCGVLCAEPGGSRWRRLCQSYQSQPGCHLEGSPRSC